MRYITSEQFLQVDKTIQDKLLKWWEPIKGDLVEYKLDNGFGRILALDSGSILDMKNGYLGNVIPLFTLQQLIEYIEEETCSKVEIQHFGIGYGSLSSWSCIASEYEGYFMDKMFEYHGNLLQAMWELTQEISK